MGSKISNWNPNSCDEINSITRKSKTSKSKSKSIKYSEIDMNQADNEDETDQENDFAE